MSRNNSSIAHEVSTILHDFSELGQEAAAMEYGIELREKGKVFDPTSGLTFGNIGEWAAFSVNQEHIEREEHFHHYNSEEY